MISCTDSAPGFTSLKDGLRVLMKCERAYGHNILAFDLPAIQKLYPKWKRPKECFDTYVTAAMRYSHIKDRDFLQARKGSFPMNLIGRHSLEAWGHRLNVPKGDVDSWEKWTPEMQTYCEQDTAVTRALILHIRKYGVSAEAVKTEHALAQYLIQQEANGWPFDHDKALELQAILAVKRERLGAELRKFFPSWKVSLGMFTPKRDDKKRGYKKGVPIERFKVKEFNPDSTAHIADRLTKMYGWKPTVFTPKGRPQVDENCLKGLTYPPIEALREYLLVGKRLEQLAEGKQAWLKTMQLDKEIGMYAIHGRVLQSGTVTHRAAHYKPNLGQVPATPKPYWKECRELFTVPDGDWLELGADVSGLELRCLAHYMALYDNGEYGKSVLAPKDSLDEIHLKNATILGTIRPIGKTWFYAFLYGAGDGKLGKILLPGASAHKQQKRGKEARAQFLAGLPALGSLVKGIKKKVAKKGYLELIDGRRVYIRSEHAALNSLLQGTGAVICKRWIVEAATRMQNERGIPLGGGWNYDYAAMGWVHDEVQNAVRSHAVKYVGDTLLASIRAMTSHFEFRIPLDGEVKTGANWAECH